MPIRMTTSAAPLYMGAARRFARAADALDNRVKFDEESEPLRAQRSHELIETAVAAVVLAAVAVPMLMPHAADTSASYTVLSDSSEVAEPLRVRLRFQAATEPAVAERVVQASLAQQKLANPFKLERRPNGDYVVIFDQKPSIAAVSRLLDDLRHAANVADVAIDDG